MIKFLLARKGDASVPCRFLARDPETGGAFVKHQANAPSGGQVTDIDLGAFLSGPGSPEHDALLHLIGASIFNPRGTEAEDEPGAVNTGKEWSDAEMNALGEMLVRGVSIDEISRRLRRDKIEGGGPVGNRLLGR